MEDLKLILENMTPISPKEKEFELRISNKWYLIDKTKLQKTYSFRTIKERNSFMLQVLEFENEQAHHADITIKSKDVIFVVFTKNINAITDLDKEYAKTVDAIWKDIIYADEQY